MNLSEKRQDAAHTLVVPYDATPQMVDAAYERRLAQRFGLDNIDYETFNRGSAGLYDARIRMKFAPNQQWLAQLKLFLTSTSDKMQHILKTQIATLHKNATDDTEQLILANVLEQLKNIQRKYNVLRFTAAYNVTGLLSMMAYDRISPNHGPIVPMIAYGSMLIAGFAMGLTMDSLDKKRRKLSGTLDALKLWKILRQMQPEK